VIILWNKEGYIEGIPIINENEGYIQNDKGKEKNMDIVLIDFHLKTIILEVQ
jgi:hypothetical protein